VSGKDEEAVDVEIEHPHVHHHGTGHAWLDKVLPVSALFVSFISIMVAWHHGTVMKELVHQNERLVQANSLPHLQIAGSNMSDSGEARVSLEVSNAGVGPAEVRSVQVLVDGRPVSRLPELLRACCAAKAEDYRGIVSSTLAGAMIRPGETLHYVRFAATPANSDAWTALDKARKSDRMETRICYCSVFEECWQRSSRSGDRPRPVGQCPVPQPQYTE
jgi:archaellum component FlaF (FlaF/FlaG flagellin family)